MAKITINEKTVEVPEGITLIQACEIAGVEIPRFCYHERLEIAGNCRMCLVEVEGGPPKPVASCAMSATDGMKVKTDSLMVKKAREGAMEFLLANHPLDCPICDQAGECDLQDQSFTYGNDNSRFTEDKRAVVDKDIGPLVKTTMTRCIHCTRCVRFMDDVAGTGEMGMVNRGENVEITTYLEKSLTSELSGNIIDLCPVGALTSKPYAFKARSWELKKTETIDVMDAVGSNIRVDSRGLEIMRILPSLNEEINEEWISDKTRFCYDGFKYQRLDTAYIKQNGRLNPVTIEEACKFIADKIKPLRGNQIAALTGNLESAENVLALKLLMEKLESDNIDCRPFASKINPEDRASYTFNTTIAGIEEADSCLLIGTNPRVEAPIINARIRKRYLAGDFKIASIGYEGNLNYSYSNLGISTKALKEIMNGKSEYTKILNKSSKPMIIIGADALKGEDGETLLNHAKQIAEKYGVVTKDWNGFNMLHNNASLVGALDVGFTSKKTNRQNILEAAESKNIKVVYLAGVDDEDVKAVEKNSFVIYQGSHGEVGAKIADVILPAASYVESDSTYVNTEGRAQNTQKVLFAPGKAKDGWEIIRQLSRILNIDLGYSDLSSLKKILAETNPIFANVGNVNQNQWVKAVSIKDAGVFSDNDLLVKEDNFYKTNVIARNSKILSSCSNALNTDVK